jgi:hypothetical protein
MACLLDCWYRGNGFAKGVGVGSKQCPPSSTIPVRRISRKKRALCMVTGSAPPTCEVRFPLHRCGRAPPSPGDRGQRPAPCESYSTRHTTEDFRPRHETVHGEERSMHVSCVCVCVCVRMCPRNICPSTRHAFPARSMVVWAGGRVDVTGS